MSMRIDAWRRHRYRIAALVLVGLAALWLWPTAPPPISAAGAIDGPVCDATGDPGGAGRDTSVRTAAGLAVTVVAPSDYQAGRGYGLIVAFAPAGHSPAAAERFYRLTSAATARGWIVAYPAAVPLSRRALVMQQQVAQTVAKRWCIDRRRIVYLGHSDGGSIAEGLMLRFGERELRPSQVIASAAGIRGEDLRAESCSAPFALTLIHDPADQRFPNWGVETARWWAQCWRCTGDAQAVAAGRCAELGPCANGARLRYCHATQGHLAWPRETAALFDWISGPHP